MISVWRWTGTKSGEDAFYTKLLDPARLRAPTVTYAQARLKRA